MKKLILAGAMALALVVPGAAAAGPGGQGQNCEQGAQNQNFCGDTITVDPATPEQCPAGGIVVTVNDLKYLVCNGEAGANGAPGATGATGDAGVNGVPGATGATGVPGVDGLRGLDGVVGVTPAGKACVSRRHFRMTLMPRFHGAKRVWLTVAGKEKLVKVNGGKVAVDFRGKPRGMFAVIVRKDDIKRQKRTYTLCGAGNVSAYNVVPRA